MRKRNLRELLVDAESEVNRVDMPGDVDRRLRARLFQKARTRRWAWTLAATAAAALALLVVWPRENTAPQLDGFSVTAPSPDLKVSVMGDQTIDVSVGSCTLVDAAAGEALAVTAPASLRREPDGVRVLAGTVVVSVQKRKAGVPSAKVLVSHGVIEVLGTCFTVVQRSDRGSVTLHEGEIRFQDLSGGSRALAPGERLEWPPPPATAPAIVEAPAPAPAAPSSKTKRPMKAPAVEPIVFRDPEDLLQQVDVLRSRGLFADAARYLAHGLTTELAPGTRERFSYELGAILTYRLNDPKAACAHWVQHARRYPAGRYQTEVLQASTHLACEGVPR